MIESFEVTVPAPGGPQARRADVWLPDVEEGPLPVLYLFDGQTAFFDERAPFGESLRLGEMLSALGAKFAVAAVDSDPKDRLTEYSPFPFRSPYGDSAGGGAVYLDWLSGAFKREVEARYPVLCGPSYLAGCSMGGLMTLFALCKKPETFAGGAAFSPSLWTDPAACAEMIRRADGKDFRPVFYFDYGTRELKSRGERQREGISACCSALLEKGASFTFRLEEGGSHSEASWRARFPAALRFLGLL